MQQNPYYKFYHHNTKFNHQTFVSNCQQLVDVKTGEEDEEVMYKQRARLYRYVKDLSVWKERGVGDVKLLRHKDTGLLRLIMEQVRLGPGG